MAARRRVGAVIIRDSAVPMVRERAINTSGVHDGNEYLTLPGGGIEPGEDSVAAVIREVREEVGLEWVRLPAAGVETEGGLPVPLLMYVVPGH